MSKFQMTNLRRDVLGAIRHWPMTATEVCRELEIQDGSKTGIGRTLSWACEHGYAVRAGSVRIEGKRGCQAFLYRVTDKGLALYEVMRGINLKSPRARQTVEVVA